MMLRNALAQDESFSLTAHSGLIGPNSAGKSTVLNATLGLIPYGGQLKGAIFASTGLWIGLLGAAGFLAGAVQMRRHRGPL
jgi:ABC-type Mn2+/Zn2+ transport system ATPase subunit